MPKFLSTAVAPLSVVILLLAASRSNACVEIDATTVSGTTYIDYDADLLTEYTFSCPTGEFLQHFEIDEAELYGDIQAIRFKCSDGTDSGWFGYEDEIDPPVSETFDIGMYALSSNAMLAYSSSAVDTSPSMGSVFLYGSSFAPASSASSTEFTYFGPYGYLSTSTYSTTTTNTTCHASALGTGFTIWTNSVRVYGIQLKCSTLSATCIPPGLSYEDTPPPVASTPAPILYSISDDEGNDGTVDCLPTTATSGESTCVSCSSDEDSLSTGIIIATSVGGVALLCALSGLVACCLHNERTVRAGATHQPQLPMAGVVSEPSADYKSAPPPEYRAKAPPISVDATQSTLGAGRASIALSSPPPYESVSVPPPVP